MRAIAAVVILFTGLLMNARGAVAEPCSMIGCKGQVGYVFLPAPVCCNTKPPRFFLSGQQCLPPRDDNPFGGDTLPAVNAVVAIRVPTRLLLQQDIEKNLPAFHPEQMERTGASCAVTWAQPELGNGLDQGNKVTILGYRSFVGQHTIYGKVRTTTYDEQLLFAMILIDE